MVYVIALHALWVALAFTALTYWLRLREVGQAPTVPLSQVRPGMEARFRGRTAFHGAPRTSPIGAQPAVWFDWLLEEDQFLQRGGPPAVASDSSKEPFAIVDNAGYRLLVYPAVGEFSGVRESKWDNEYPATIDATLRDRLERGAETGAPLDDGSKLHFTERWLPVGETCFVLGRVEAPDPEHGPEIRGLISAGGARQFLIATGAPVEMQAALRRKILFCAIAALAAFVGAVLAMIYVEI